MRTRVKNVRLSKRNAKLYSLKSKDKTNSLCEAKHGHPTNCFWNKS